MYQCMRLNSLSSGAHKVKAYDCGDVQLFFIVLVNVRCIATLDPNETTD